MRKTGLLVFAFGFAAKVFAAGASCTLTLNPTVSQTICSGQSATISANPSGGLPPYTYQWDMSVVTNSVVVSPSVTTTYTVTVTDAAGCTAVANNIVVNVIPPLYVSINTPYTACEGDTVSIGATAGGGTGGPYTYQWSPNIGTGAGPFAMTADTNLTLTITVSDGSCSTSFSAGTTLEVFPRPVAYFSGVSGYDISPAEFCFTDSSTDSSGSIAYWMWDFGDGNGDSILYNSCHQYSAPGSYDVTLCVTTAYGCSSCSTRYNYVNLTEADFEEVKYSPNPFTSDLNFYHLDGADIIIYDMTGKEVLSKFNCHGHVTFNTSALAEGVYILKAVQGSLRANYQIVKVNKGK